MKRLRILLFITASLFALRCATTPPPPAAVVPQGEDRYLIDPRIGYTGAMPEGAPQKLESAWRYLMSGDPATAQRLLTEIRTKFPDYAPAALAEAAIEIRGGNLDAAQAIVDRVQSRLRDYAAAEVYAAEIAYRQGRLRTAFDLYGAAAARPNAPAVVAERHAAARQALFTDLFARARTASGAQATPLLYEALVVDPGARDARILLGRRLLEQRNYLEARRVIEPIVQSADADRTDVQEMLAEIDAGRGRYEEAIARYDRLARREKDPRFARRLEQIKEEWSTANMPPQYRRALESEAITRADLAVLLYWQVASIRFAQNLASPPIATDVSEVPGREEIVRAIAIGLLQVDPVTRRVGPHTPVNATALVRYAARVLTVRGAQCSRIPAAGETEIARVERVLAACGVTNPVAAIPPDAPVSGREAVALVDQLERVLSR